MRRQADTSDIRPDRWARAFAHPAFATARDANAPSAILNGSDLALEWANRAMTSLFEVSGYEGLQGRISDAAGHLAQVSRTLRPGAPPRLERLRYSWGVKVRNLTALCARVDDAEGWPALALAFLGPQTERACRSASWSDEAEGRASGAGSDEADGAGETPDAANPPDLVLGTIRNDAGDAPEGGVSDRGLIEAREMMRSVLGGAETGRFVWRTDAADVLAPIDSPVLRHLGLPLCAGAATALPDEVAAFDGAAADHLRRVLSARTTWSGVEVLCPVADGDFSLPLVLGASPHFDAARRFAGFRGFGRLDSRRLVRRAVAAPSADASTLADGAASDAAPMAATEPDVPRPAPVAEGPACSPLPIEPAQVLDATIAGRDDGNGAKLPSADAAADVRGVQGQPVETEQLGDIGTSPDVAAMQDRAANVVQLWPVHAAPARSPQPVTKFPFLDQVSFEPPGAGPAPSIDLQGDAISGLDTAAGPDQESKGALSSSEHLAFEAIGRALGPGPGRAAAQQSQEPDGSPGAAGGDGNDLSSHAAALVEHMPVGLLVVRDKSVLFANEALRAELGFDTPAEMLRFLGLFFVRRSPEDDEAQATLFLPSARGETMGFAGSARVMTWNGEPATLWTLSSLDIGDGAAEQSSPPAGFDAETSDDEVAHLAALVDVSGEAMALIDGAARVVRLNRQAELWFGRERRKAEGESFLLLLASESRAAASALLNQLKSDPNPRAQARGECVVRAADGAAVTMEMRLARIGGQRFAVVWRDLSAQRNLERDLARARRSAAQASDQQPEFLAHVSHQIRTPLNAILGFAEIMMDERFGPFGNPRYKDYLKDIHTSGTQVLNLIDGLMNLSRIEAGRLDLRIGAVDINKVIVDCVAEAHPQAHRERVIVRTSFGSRLPPVMADNGSARQIIANLLSNAVKFNEPGGQVIVSTALSDAGMVVVRIRDTGIGMSDTDIAAALEPFSQLAPAKNTTGTGLGLPLTKALIGANGASLSIRSRPREGTMVEVTFQPTIPAPARLPA